MKSYGVLFSLLLASAVTALADERTTVTFVDPDRFADAGFSSYETMTALREIEQHLHKIGQRQLGPGARLAVEILDLDLAGRWDPRVTRVDPRLRVVTDGAHVPSARLRYRLERDGRLIASGEERVTDLAFLRRTNPYPDDEPLRHEKKMLDDWFATRIVKALGSER